MYNMFKIQLLAIHRSIVLQLLETVSQISLSVGFRNLTKGNKSETWIWNSGSKTQEVQENRKVIVSVFIAVRVCAQMWKGWEC